MHAGAWSLLPCLHIAPSGWQVSCFIGFYCRLDTKNTNVNSLAWLPRVFCRHVFPSFLLVSSFSRAFCRPHVFTHFLSVTCFTSISAGYTFSTPHHPPPLRRRHVFPRKLAFGSKNSQNIYWSVSVSQECVHIVHFFSQQRFSLF